MRFGMTIAIVSDPDAARLVVRAIRLKRDDWRSPRLTTELRRRVRSALGLIPAESVADAAERVGTEIARLLSGATVRDRATGVRRPAEPADIAILFRSRDSHREFEKALARRGILTYVYKGLGFFEAEEMQDAIALLRYLADPSSDLRAATLLRSRLVRLSDVGLARFAPRLAGAIIDRTEPEALAASRARTTVTC